MSLSVHYPGKWVFNPPTPKLTRRGFYFFTVTVLSLYNKVRFPVLSFRSACSGLEKHHIDVLVQGVVLHYSGIVFDKDE